MMNLIKSLSFLRSFNFHGNTLATKNRIAYALPIIQIMQILSAKSHKQMRLRLIYRERVRMMIN